MEKDIIRARIRVYKIRKIYQRLKDIIFTSEGKFFGTTRVFQVKKQLSNKLVKINVHLRTYRGKTGERTGEKSRPIFRESKGDQFHRNFFLPVEAR